MPQNIANWESLPTDVQHLVAQRVNHAASLATMRATCISMRAAVDQNDVWEPARKRLAGYDTLGRADDARVAFIEEVQAKRVQCRKLGDAKHEVEREISWRCPPGAAHGAPVGVARAASDMQKRLQAKADAYRSQREEIVVPFAAEGLRAKPYSPRQQLQRAVQAQIQALRAWWEG